MEKNLQQLAARLDGQLYDDKLWRSIYATDASVYRELPLAVCYPKNKQDLKELILFAKENNTSLIPRTAGTSLAGQCVGKGIVVDVSKHFTKILSLDTVNKTVSLQPGVIRDDLNRMLKEHGLFFGPNTSTSNQNFEFSSNKQRIIFKSLWKEQSGVYQCIARNEAGEVTGERNISIVKHTTWTKGLIAGVIIGILVLVGLIVFLSYKFCWTNRQLRKHTYIGLLKYQEEF